MDNEPKARSGVQAETDVADLSSEKSSKVAAASVNQSEETAMLATAAIESKINRSAEPSELSASGSDSIVDETTNDATTELKMNEGEEDNSKGSNDDETPSTAEIETAQETLQNLLRKIRDGPEQQKNHVSKHDSGFYWEEEGSG